MADRDQREQEIFNEALELESAEERLAYVKDACSNDVALRQGVEALLQALSAGGNFIPTRMAQLILPDVAAERTPEPDLDGAPPADASGTVIGRYKLLEKIGEGGCGVVFMAEQEEPVRRKVALKIIKPGMDSRQVIARFEAERQALAMMDHPNIARFLDAGVTEERVEVRSQKSEARTQETGDRLLSSDSCLLTSGSGRPYFVMELVRGVRITDYCAEHHLSTRQRLDLFIAVCHAVQHAHQKGIIHRDLKPSNILVTENDGVPVPKVIDFGIAKATEQKLTDKTLFTQFTQFLGTPAYMSPEQAAMTSLDIDTRSDIYSLGVLLYELLTGTTPFDAQELLKAGFDEMRRIIRETEPERPSTRLATGMRGRKGEKEKGRGVGAPPSPPAAGGEGRGEEGALSVRTAPHPNPLPARASRGEGEEFGRVGLAKPLSTDLDWIVMKCLEKDRARRYETASGLAADIQRHMGNEPVVARPPSAAYRFSKLARRNKVVFAAGSTVVVVLVAGVLVSAWQAVRATNAEREQNRLRQMADENAKQARIEAAKNEQIAKFLKETIGWENPAIGRERDERWLQNILSELSNWIKDVPDASWTARYSLGVAYERLGEYVKAEAVIREALGISRQVIGEAHPDTQRYVAELAEILSRQGNNSEAEQVFAEALEAAAASPEGSVRILQLRGHFYASHGRWKDALVDISGATELQPRNHELHHLRAPLLVQNGDLEGYYKHRRTVLALFGGTTNPVVAERMAKDCSLLPLFDAELETIRKWADTAAAEGESHPVWTYFQLAKALAEYRQGNYARARDWAQKVLLKAGQRRERDLQAYMVMAMAQWHLKQPPHARAALVTGLDLARTDLPQLDDGNLAESWHDLLRAHILMREAKSLIEPAPPESSGTR